MFTETKPSISVNKARKLLGNIAKSMSDEEVEALISQLEVLAHTVIEAFVVQKSNSK